MKKISDYIIAGMRLDEYMEIVPRLKPDTRLDYPVFKVTWWEKVILYNVYFGYANYISGKSKYIFRDYTTPYLCHLIKLFPFHKKLLRKIEDSLIKSIIEERKLRQTKIPGSLIEPMNLTLDSYFDFKYNVFPYYTAMESKDKIVFRMFWIEKLLGFGIGKPKQKLEPIWKW